MIFFHKIKNIIIEIVKKIRVFPDKITEKLHSERVDEGLYKLSQFQSFKRSTLLLNFISIAFLTVIIWGSLAKVNQVVRAQGEVIPSSKIQVLQSAFDGVVDNINADLGQVVKKGDVLFGIDHEQAKSDYEITLNEVETRERKVEILEKLVLSGSEAEVRLLDEKLSLGDAKKRYNAFKQKYEKSLIKAPVDGIINNVDVTTEGQVIRRGEQLAQMVADDDQLVIEVGIMTKDIASVNEGQKANIYFSAYDASVYGSYAGIVGKISPTTTQTSENTPPVYIARITVINDERLKKISLQSGMQVEASILGEKRSVISYVFSPITKLSQKAFRE